MSITDSTTDTITHITPSFKTFGPEDKGKIDKVTSKFLPYSDFNLIGLICWNANKDNCYTLLDDLFIIKIKDYLSNAYLFAVIGSDLSENNVNILRKISSSYNLVPEFMISELKKHKCRVEEDRDSFDYVINTRNLASLSGGDYKSIRRHIKTFYDQYPLITTKILDFGNESDRSEVINLTEEWANLKQFDKEKVHEDVTSIENFIKISNQFNTLSIGVYDKDKLVAVSLNELLHHNWAMGHFGKALNQYKNISLYMEYITSKWLDEHGYSFINIQQDTGLQGLREHKEQMHPEFYLKKYTVKFL